MTNTMKIIGGDDIEPNLEETTVKPFNSSEALKQTISVGAIVPVAVAVTKLIATVIQVWVDVIKGDDKKREAFTKNFVEEASKQFPEYNVVIIHTNHGVIGDYIKDHYELPMFVGTCGYEIYFSHRENYFKLTNNGDGGYLNWAYLGYFNRDDSNPPYKSITAYWG